jgi:ligand-binding sensor domain-containing protein
MQNKKQTMKQLAKLLALFLLSAFETSCGQTQTNVPKVKINPTAIRPEIKDAITTNVWDIEQDRNGNIWFAADDGVYRYDGKSFTNITGKMIPVPVFSILEDSKGNFWFGTYGAGAYYYDGKTFQNYTTLDGLADNSVMPVYEDKSGIIWLGTGGGVSRFDGKSFRNFGTRDGLTHNDVHAIVQDKTGKMWFGTRGDITIYDGKTFTTLTDKDGRTFNNVWTIVKDKKGNIWFGADGLWRYDGSAFIQIDKIGAGVIINDKKGNILTSTGGPLYRFDEQFLSDKKPHATVIKTKYEGLRNLPFGILVADDGSFWIGAERYSYDARLPDGQAKALTEYKQAAGQQ